MPRQGLFNRAKPGGIVPVDDLEEHPGEVWFVDSNAGAQGADAAGYGQSPDAPCLTVDYAIGLATASQGDTIYVLPGHNESLTAATSLVIDKIGLAIIGLGRGMNRPIFDYDQTAATIEMDADDCRLSNVILRASAASTVVAINVDADDCEIDNCFFTYESTGDEFITCIALNAFDRTYIHDNLFETEPGAGAATEAIHWVDANDVIVDNNIFRGTWTQAVIAQETTLSARCIITNNIIYNSDTSVYNGIDTAGLSSTGIVAHNHVTALYAQAGAIGKLIRTGDLQWHDNTFANAVSEGATGMAHTVPIPATTST